MAADKKKEFKKTRLAPTPSGFLHLGNVFSFALTAALAAETSARILLRIDDLDRERLNKQYVQDIFDTLHFLQIPWHEGPKDVMAYENDHSQLQRLPLYQKALEQLRESGKVYACACSRAQVLRNNSKGIYPCTCRHKNIPLDAKNVCWRINTADAKIMQVKRWRGDPVKAGLPEEMQDFVVRKRDGLPAYQLSSVVDDLHFGVDLVVRGEDLWPSTLAQLYLADVLRQQAFTETAFYHHPLLLDRHDRKLSKSAGHTSVHYLRQHGYKAADVYRVLGEQLNLPVRVTGWEDFRNYFSF